MTLPETITVGYQTVKLVSASVEDRTVGILGEYRADHNIIVFAKHLRGHQLANTLIHELLHALWHTQGIGPEESCEETVVTSLANGLTQVLRDNPALVGFLRKEATR